LSNNGGRDIPGFLAAINANRGALGIRHGRAAAPVAANIHARKVHHTGYIFSTLHVGSCWLHSRNPMDTVHESLAIGSASVGAATAFVTSSASSAHDSSNAEAHIMPGMSKYDFVKIRVHLGSHYYVLSRFLVSRMLQVFSCLLLWRK